MKVKCCVIYKVTNLITGSVYIDDDYFTTEMSSVFLELDKDSNSYIIERKIVVRTQDDQGFLSDKTLIETDWFIRKDTTKHIKICLNFDVSFIYDPVSDKVFLNQNWVNV